ncbi:acyl carrier protein [Saccharobesus litoralis]|nr:phosphopantetheine-binding protein [Saccharobesus litoralis]
MSTVQQTIYSVLREIQERNGYPLKEINEEVKVVKNLGFSSLDVAELVAVLEMEFGIDPFSQGVSIMEVHSVGELIAVYQNALSAEPA